MKLYKMTDQNLCTYGGFQWYIGKKEAKSFCEYPDLCSIDVFHAYKNINLGLLLNPIHANIDTFRLFEAEGNVVVQDHGKVGCFELVLNKEIPYPEWYQDPISRKKVQIQFAIFCAESVLHIFEEWYPENNRPRKAIEAAKNYLENPTEENRKAAYDAAYDAYDAYIAANAAANATANAAVYAAYYACNAAVYAAYYACNATANAAVYAAYYACNAAANAATVDFCKLADEAVKVIMKKGKK